MAKFSEKFEDGLSVVAEKVDSNKYLGSIKDAFTAYVPFIIAGSFGTLLTSLVSSTSTGLAQWVPWLANLGPAFSALSFCTISCMTLPIVYLIATQLARRNGTPEYATGVLCLAAYISMVPNAVTATVTDAAENILEASAAGLPSSALGAQGLFIGMILTVIVCELFSALTKIERLKIHMPDSVPPAITSSFNTLIPIFLLLVLTSVCGALFELAIGSYINEWMYSVLQRPIEVLANTPAGVIFLALFSQLFWFLGIHGGLVIEPIRSPPLPSPPTSPPSQRAAWPPTHSPAASGRSSSWQVVPALPSRSSAPCCSSPRRRTRGQSPRWPSSRASLASASPWCLACRSCSTRSLQYRSS